MARELRLQIDGDSAGARKALDSTADASDQAADTLRALAREFKRAAKESGTLDGDLKGVERELGGTAKQADKAAAQLRETARAAAQLDAAMAASRGEIERLNKELAETGDAKTVRLLEQQYREYDRIARVKKRILEQDKGAAEDPAKAIEKQYQAIQRTARLKKRIAADEKAAYEENGQRQKVLDRIAFQKRSPLGRLAGRVGSLGSSVASKGAGFAMDQLNDIGVGTLVKADLAAAVSPVVGAVGGGALLAGAGIAGAGLGVAGAVAGNPERFKSEWNDAIRSVTSRWKIASTDEFEQPLSNSIKILQKEFDGLDVEGPLKNSAKYLEPLARGVAGFIGPFVKGLDQLTAKAGPLIAILERDLPVLGMAFEHAFGDIGDGVSGSADAFEDLIGVIGTTVLAVGKFVEGASAAYEQGHRLLEWLGIATPRTATYGRTIGGAADSTSHWVDVEKLLRDAADEANSKISDQLGLALDLDAANDSATIATQKFRDSLKEHGNAMLGDTEAALANREALRGAIQDYDNVRQKAIASSDGSAAAIRKANEDFIKHLESLRDIERAAGADTTALDVYIQKVKDAAGLTVTTTFKNVYVNVGTPNERQRTGQSRLGAGEQYAAGGTVDYSGWKTVGEHGIESVFLNKGAYVATAEQTRRLASMIGSAGGGRVSAGATVQVAGNADSQLGQLIQYLFDRRLVQVFVAGQQASTRRG